MDNATVNLTALAEVRAKMTIGRLSECCKDQPEDHPCRLVWSVDEDCPAFSLEVDDGRVSKANVRGLVAEHNAIGVLIEVARTVIDRDSAQAAYDEAKLSGDRDAFGSARDRLEASRAKYRAALAKVSL